MSWSPGSKYKQSSLKARTRPAPVSTTVLPLIWDRGRRVPRALSCEVVNLVPQPQAHAGQINNPHQASPQVTQKLQSQARRVGLGDLLRIWYSLSQSGRDEDSSSTALPPLLNMISCYDMVPGDVGHALIRYFLLGPVGPWLSSSSQQADGDITY